MTAQHNNLPTPGPQGSEDLTAKILQRTRVLQTSGAEALQLPYRRFSWRKPVFWGMGALVVTGLLGGTFYLAGAPVEESTLTAGALTANWPQSNWPQSSTGAAESESSVLSDEDVAGLRAAGWSCPDLADLGFRLTQAEGAVVEGVPTVKLTLAEAGHSAVVYERHRGSSSAEASSIEGSSMEGPVNPLTGNPAGRDGFQALGDGKVWLNPGPTWQAVLSTAEANYALVSDLPPTALQPTTAALAAAGTAAIGDNGAATANQNNDLPGRIVRGLSRILALG